jgi:hypothetical protein
MQTNEFTLQAAQALDGIIAKGILSDMVQARNDNEYQMLAYGIAMGLDQSTKDPIKFGLIFAVVDLIDAM